LDSPFLLLEDELLATIPALEAGRWTAAVRSRWIRKGDIGHHYGHRWEEYLIWLLERKGWEVLGRNINLKHNEMGHCEIDLLLGRDDVCLVIQMKAFAGQGTNMYDHWKNRQTIEKGISQAKLAVTLLTSTYRLSDLVGKTAAKSIKIIRPVVLSTLHYFNGWKSDDVTVLSISALRHLMRGAPVDFWSPTDKVSHESGEKQSGQLTGAELIDFIDNPVDWRISQGTAVHNEKSVMIEGITWFIPYIGTDGDPFEIYPSV
jgi:Holliday junction resolvase-like predicted endonuclease